MDAHDVSPILNSAKYDGPECIRPMADEDMPRGGQLSLPVPMTPLSKSLAQVSALVFAEWLLLTPPGNDLTRPQKEWHQERSFETLQLCASYRERQADEWIKRMETVPEGSTDYVTYDRTVKRFLLSKCVLAESAS